MSYYNTTESTQPDLANYRLKAKSQEERILESLKQSQNRGQSFSPSLIKSVLFPGTPITSVRRALTNLTNAGELVKTDKQVRGPYGRPEFEWRLADKYSQQELFT